MKHISKLIILSLILISSAAQARVTFEQLDFDVNTFRDYNRIEENCAAPAASSFWCEHLEDTLSFIPTKGADFFISNNGEILAIYTKQQKGQDYTSGNGGYRNGIDNGQNLIPIDSSLPAGAILLNGDYIEPSNVESSWTKLTETSYEGIFRFDLNDIRIEKILIVSNISHTVDVTINASRSELSEASEEIVVQYVVPGIAKANNPVFKIGQGESSSTNPVSTPVPEASYISAQTSARHLNNAKALILRPQVISQDLAAQFVSPNLIALQKTLAAEDNASIEMRFDQYGGQDELVRFFQEGYKDLPGLFNPNILGRLSLGILWALQQIHDVVGSWGLTIMVLTLIFRLLIWPLINTQTKSMYAMQRLQPKLQELQKKYKDDREKLTQETMKLYQTEKVNPAGGCLPVVAQMPLFIILWRVFANFEFNEGFLWIPDLGQPDPFYILPVLYIGVIFAQSYFMAQGNKQSLQQQLLINGIFIFFIISFPAGVTLYWVVSMLVQVFQYWLIKRNQPALPVATAGAGGGGFADIFKNLREAANPPQQSNTKTLDAEQVSTNNTNKSKKKSGKKSSNNKRTKPKS